MKNTTDTIRNVNTVKLMYNDHTRSPKFVAVVDWKSLFRDSSIVKKTQNGTPKW